jgi:glycosyltransferase involved in cell wall biosynthesis
MNPLSICIIAQNEERNLARILQSVRDIADEIILLDGGSTDRTQEVARSHGAKLFCRPYTNMSDQKNHSVSLASNRWVFVLDADEELSPELREAVKEWKQQVPQYAVYEMARLTWYLGAWIHHSRWYPDWQPRIYLRDKASYSGAMHSGLRFDGKPGRLPGDLLHYTIRNFAEHEAKVEKYTTVIAQEMFDNGKRKWRGALWFSTPWSWVRHFILGAGFLDGYRGAIIAQMAARSVRLKYAKLGKLVQAEQRTRRSGGK